MRRRANILGISSTFVLIHSSCGNNVPFDSDAYLRDEDVTCEPVCFGEVTGAVDNLRLGRSVALLSAGTNASDENSHSLAAFGTPELSEDVGGVIHFYELDRATGAVDGFAGEPVRLCSPSMSGNAVSMDHTIRVAAKNS